MSCYINLEVSSYVKKQKHGVFILILKEFLEENKTKIK